jgi:flagellar hook-associated protein 1 FlgK
VGTALSAAKTGQSLQTSLVAQARSLRDQSSGVDLNQEAINVVELQTSYQAATKLLTVVDSLTQSILDLIK